MVHAVSQCKQEMSVPSPALSAVEIEAVFDLCVTCMPMIPVLLKWCCRGSSTSESVRCLCTVAVVMLGQAGQLDKKCR